MAEILPLRQQGNPGRVSTPACPSQFTVGAASGKVCTVFPDPVRYEHASCSSEGDATAGVPDYG